MANNEDMSAPSGSVAAFAPRIASIPLLERFVRIVQDDVNLPCMRVRVRQNHALKSVDIDAPLLVLPLQGCKRIRRDRQWLTVTPGTALFIPQPAAVDVENVPDAVSQTYMAIGIAFESPVLEAARALVRQPSFEGRRGIATFPMQPHVQDLEAWLNALEAGDQLRACHALVGIALRLYEAGHRDLLQPVEPTLSMRIRAMISADPSRDWSSEEIEDRLAVSGATLRRHLAAEGCALRRVLADARLSHALHLLVTTRLSVKLVAQRVGYLSVPTFAKRFSERYGVPPSRVAG
jgi:AraC-like DNA-binding protein